MLPGQELEIFSGEGQVAIEGDGGALVAEVRKVAREHMLRRPQHQAMLRMKLVLHAEPVAQRLKIVLQRVFLFVGADLIDHRIGDCRFARVQLQQPVAPLAQLAPRVGGERRGILQQGIESIAAVLELSQQALAERFEDHVTR